MRFLMFVLALTALTCAVAAIREHARNVVACAGGV